jgi:hypothetical protein
MPGAAARSPDQSSIPFALPMRRFLGSRRRREKEQPRKKILSAALGLGLRAGISFGEPAV